jgi:DNA polymerase I-like protein with 3'-5' exonuclease and polymerase domains
MFGGLNKFRSSILTLHDYYEVQPTVVIPVLTPSFLFLVKDKSFAVNRDYAKIAYLHRRIQNGLPVSELLCSPRKANLGLGNIEVFQYLNTLLEKLEVAPVMVAMDIETRQGYKDCIGLAYDEYESFTIPFSERYEEINTNPHLLAFAIKNKKEVLVSAPIGAVLTKFRNYWSIEDEIAICDLLWKVMLHKNCRHIGQNYNYDCQYYWHHWKINISSHCDTMILHHVMHNTLQKDLATLASIYCMDYVYWKDEIEIKDNETRWTYNGKDCCYTLSIAKLLLRLMERQDQPLQDFYKFQQTQVSPTIVTIMNRGVNVDAEQKENLLVQFTALMEGCIEKINYIFMEEVNLNSTPQVKNAFKTLLGIKPIINRKTRSESFGSDAMLVYLEEYPEWRTLLTLFLEYKSIRVFVRTFLSAKLDNDGRMRCDYNPAGTKTYRLSSRKNVFGNGMNLSNVPSHGKIDLRYSLLELDWDDNVASKEAATDNGLMEFQTEVGTIYQGKTVLPNCKRIFIPDSDEWIFWDGDYSAGDLHFVVWESDCTYLKKVLREGKDPYSILASNYYQREITKADNERQIFKAVCHGTNYLGTANTLAAKAGLKVSVVKSVIGQYFTLCPEIPAWHSRLETEARKTGCIRNIWGAKNEVWDFNDPMWLNKLVAWQPQSSLAILVNKALVTLETVEKGKNIQTKLQTHDSLTGQFLKIDLMAPKRIKNYLEIEIPYKDKLIIPADVKISELSYGDCKKISKDSIYYLN